MTLMRLWHVFLDGGLAAARAAAGVNGHAFMVVEDLDHPVRKPDLDLLADQAVGHGIEVVQHIDVVIGMDLGLLPFSAFKGFRGQCLQGGPLDLVKQIAARPADPAHRAGIQIAQKLGDRRVQRLDREELHVAQPGQDPAFDDQHRALDLAFVARLARAGRQIGRVVMRRHVGEGLGDGGLEPQRLGHRRLEIVADNRLGHAAEELQRPDLCFDPVGQRLGQAGPCEGVAGRPKHRDEDLGLPHPPLWRDR